MGTASAAGRPYLEQPVGSVIRLTPRQQAALRRLGIATIRDLLFHFPARYEPLGQTRPIRDLNAGERATITAEVIRVEAAKTRKKQMRIAEGIVRDATGLLAVVWFNQPYVAMMLKPGTNVRLSGKVSQGKSGLLMAHPWFEPLAPGEAAAGHSPLLPIYPETYGITSRWLRAQIRRLLDPVGGVPDPLPTDILRRYHLPAFARALHAIHAPRALAEAEAARKRFSFQEIFLLQLTRQRERKRLEREPGIRIPIRADLLKRFVASLPFTLTDAQRKAIWHIVKDFEKPHPMARLLEGDVGSGKTVVAAAAALAAVASGYQVAYLAPTEILARQHFEEFTARLGPFRVRVGFLTSAEARRFPSRVNPDRSARISKRQLLRWCLSGETQVLIGTHAVIEDRVRFKGLAFVIVDEQHRFGVRQRAALAVRGTEETATRNTEGIPRPSASSRRGSAVPRPHFLSMSATPIPRTLALTIYGDLDLTVLDEVPPGREPIQTRIVPPHERAKTYGFIREEVRRGGQVFVICPKIEAEQNANTPTYAHDVNPLPPARYLLSPRQQATLDWSEVKSVKAEYTKLAEEVFPDLRVGMIHGKMKPREKETVMRKFKDGGLDILVSTSVVEVGVDVPNASVMVIESGERFGLAQLHQFRGRVGRGSRKSYCFVFTTSEDHGGNRRLKALQEVRTGFELAEYDLHFRGPGELSGTKQWGVSDVGMEALKNIKMVEAARAEAGRLIAEDPELERHPLLREQVAQVARAVHLE